MKRIYLMGGFGNNLFQIDHGLTSLIENEKIEFVTNLIEDPIYSKLFGWTFHPYSIDKQMFLNDINLVRLSFLNILYDLFCLMLVKFFKLKINRVGFEEFILQKVNFGYYQFSKKTPSLLINNDYLKVKKNYKTVVHLRLGDSPTLHADLISQTKLMKTLNKEHYLVITNDVNFAKDWFGDKDLNITIQRNSVLKDFNILLNAETLIGPKSTFSWMAAYLSNKIKFYYVNEKFWKDLKFNKKIKVVTYNHQGHI